MILSLYEIGATGHIGSGAAEAVYVDGAWSTASALTGEGIDRVLFAIVLSLFMTVPSVSQYFRLSPASLALIVSLSLS